MKKIVTGSGVGNFRNLLWCISISCIVLCAVFLSGSFMILIKSDTLIKSDYIYILTTIILICISFKLFMNNYFATCGFRFSKFSIYLPISYKVVAKFSWANIEKIYLDEVSSKIMHVDLKYSIKKLPRAKKLLKEGEIEMTHDAMCMQSIELILLNDTNSKKSDFDAIMALWGQYKASGSHKEIFHVTYDTGSLNIRNIILYTLLLVVGKLFILMI